VKNYGKMLVDDHTRMNNELKDIASRENITLPTAVNSEQRETIDRFAKLSGPHFDREFLKDSAKDHRDDIKGVREGSR
jgi:putative membrane protein